MPGRCWIPSILPAGDDQTVYLVKDDLACHGTDVDRHIGDRRQLTSQLV